MTKIFTSAPVLGDIHSHRTSVVAKVAAIKKRHNPFEDICPSGVIGEDEVRSVDDDFISKHKGHMRPNAIPRKIYDSKEYHIARVAWLVKNPLGASIDEPLTCAISVITFNYDDKIKTDKSFNFFVGNHSLAAAIIREDDVVQVDVLLNDPDDEKFYTYAKGILGVTVKMPRA